jgi:hypothetical protein
MMKFIHARDLQEVLYNMRAQGVTLKDTEGYGINFDQSGHVFVVYNAEETATSSGSNPNGIIDISAGEAGVSGHILATPNNNGTIEVGEIKTAETQTLVYSIGTTWTASLTAVSGQGYVKPNSVSIAAVGNAPEVIDDGLGVLLYNDPTRRAVGSINYETGAVSIAYIGNKAPAAAATVTLSYNWSVFPNAAEFPKLVSLSHIVFVLSAPGTVKYELYGNDPTNVTIMPCVYNHTGITSSQLSGQHLCSDDLAGKVSINVNTNVLKRTSRYLKYAVTGGNLVAVYVYWNRLST